MESDTNPTVTASPAASSPATTDERNLALSCHLLAFLALVGVPLGNIFGPLIIYLVRRDLPFVEQHGRQVLNFQISVTIYVAVISLVFGGASFLLMLVVGPLAMPLILFGMVILVLLVVLTVIYTILAALDASAGRQCRYPCAISFLA